MTILYHAWPHQGKIQEKVLKISWTVSKLLWRLLHEVHVHVHEDHKLFKMLIIFRVINIYQKYRNLTSFVIYSDKINILPSTCDH